MPLIRSNVNGNFETFSMIPVVPFFYSKSLLTKFLFNKLITKVGACLEIDKFKTIEELKNNILLKNNRFYKI